MLMAAFLSLATTMNFDGLSPLWLRNVTTYVLATAGAKIAKNADRARGPGARPSASRHVKVLFRISSPPRASFQALLSIDSLRGVNRMSPDVQDELRFRAI